MDKCRYCDTLTRTQCDGCGCFICEEHTVLVDASNSISKKFNYCSDCANKKNKKVKQVQRINQNARDF